MQVTLRIDDCLTAKGHRKGVFLLAAKYSAQHIDPAGSIKYDGNALLVDLGFRREADGSLFLYYMYETNDFHPYGCEISQEDVRRYVCPGDSVRVSRMQYSQNQSESPPLSFASVSEASTRSSTCETVGRQTPMARIR